MDTHLQGYAKNNNPELIEFVDQRTVKEGNIRVRAKPDDENVKTILWISKANGYHPLLIGYKKMFLHGEKDGVRLKGTLRNKEKFETYFIPGNRVISLEKEVVQEEKSTSSKEEHKTEESHDEKAAIISKNKS